MWDHQYCSTKATSTAAMAIVCLLWNEDDLDVGLVGTLISVGGRDGRGRREKGRDDGRKGGRVVASEGGVRDGWREEGGGEGWQV